MYPHFIQVHAKEDGTELSVNIDHIVGFGPTGKKATIMTSDNGRWGICESYEELKQLIESSGALINMGDPRLDTKHPLTFDDFAEMKIGDPIWNSNDDEWYLFDDYSPLRIAFKDRNGNSAIAFRDDLIKTPLYRMKVTND